MRHERKQQPTVEEFLATFPPHVRRLSNILRGLIREEVPDLKEAVYPGWKLIGYRVLSGPRSCYFGFIHPGKESVQLGFEYGALLPDPHKMLQGTGKLVRHVRIAKMSDIKQDEIRYLILEAAMCALTRGGKTL